MPITDYHFQNRLFFAREIGLISPCDAQTWADQLAAHARSSPEPIVALVDALEVKHMSPTAYKIFSKASFTPNLLAVAVATNVVVSLTASNIGLLGKPGHTKIFRTLDAARQYADTILQDNIELRP